MGVAVFDAQVAKRGGRQFKAQLAQKDEAGA